MAAAPSGGNGRDRAQLAVPARNGFAGVSRCVGAEQVTNSWDCDDDEFRRGPDGVGAGSHRTAARVPADRVGQRRRPARGRGGRPGVGERRSDRLRTAVAHDVRNPPRRRPGCPRSPDLDQQRPDDVLLPGHRTRGATRVRLRRPARAPSIRPALPGWVDRHGRSGGHLPCRERRSVERPRLGRRDVHRHGAGPRRARARRARRAGSRSSVPVDRLRRRRSRRAVRHRAGLQRPHRHDSSRPGRGGVRGAPRRRGPAGATSSGVRRARRC